MTRARPLYTPTPHPGRRNTGQHASANSPRGASRAVLRRPLAATTRSAMGVDLHRGQPAIRAPGWPCATARVASSPHIPPATFSHASPNRPPSPLFYAAACVSQSSAKRLPLVFLSSTGGPLSATTPSCITMTRSQCMIVSVRAVAVLGTLRSGRAQERALCCLLYTSPSPRDS